MYLREIIIGDFFPQPTNGDHVFVSIYSKQKLICKCSIIDDQGLSKSNEVFDLEPEGDAIELDVQSLEPGKYTAKIEIGGEEWEKVLIIKQDKTSPL